MDLFQKLRTINTLSREKSTEKGLFLKRIGMLLEDGYAIKDALEFLAKIESGIVYDWTQRLQSELLTGGTFHKALENIGFSDRTCSQIYLAAQYGNYGQTIRQCGEHLLEKNDKRLKLRSLASYPVLLVGFLVGILIVMRVLIFPYMETLLTSMGSSDAVYSNGVVAIIYYSPYIISAVVIYHLILYYLLKQYLKSKTLIERVKFYTRIPLLKMYLKDYYSHFFFLEWGQLFYNGCSFQEIIQIMQGGDSSKLLNETGRHLSDKMLAGKSVYEAISSLPYFYEEGLLVISHGENIGKLGIEMLLYADYCETRLNTRIEKMMERIQPIIFSLVGLMIVAIYAALMLPMFTMMEGI